MRFPFDGDYMFHAHVSEFAELGWTGFFRVGDPSKLTAAGAAAAYCKLPWGGRGGGLMEARARAERGAGARLPAWALGLDPAGPDRGRDRRLRAARRARPGRAQRARRSRRSRSSARCCSRARSS